jgi:murein DD-endopeptidase MepM/ murein hydrolase activator NlpD
VVYIGWGNSFGNLIVIEHDVYGLILFSLYTHLNRVDVEVGDIVDSMTTIGLVGGTGAGGVEPHIHFEVRRESTFNLNIDPDTSPLGNIFWATSPQHLANGWLDLSPIFGAHRCYNNWGEDPC